MILRRLVVGPLEENCYIVADEKTKDALVIDPGDESERIVEAIKENDLKVVAVVLTHAHFDHLGAVGDIKRETGAKVLIHADDLEIFRTAKEQAILWGFEIDDIPEPDGLLKDGDVIRAGGIEFKVIHTPGHSPGGISLYGKGIVFTGDTIFRGSVGRTDLPGGDIRKLKNSFRRLLELPEETRMLSGHGPETTVRREKEENFFIHEV